MKNNFYFIALRNNCFICKRADHEGPFVFRFEGILNMPNVPFYHHIYNDEFADYFRLFKEFCRNDLFNDSLLSKIIKPDTYLALPDDALEVDRRIVKEYLLTCGSRNVTIASECALLAPPAGTYLALAYTARMIVLTLMTDGQIMQQKYLEKKAYPVEELRDIIRAFVNYRDFSQIPVYLTGESIKPYSGLGTAVEAEAILDNYISLIKNQIPLQPL